MIWTSERRQQNVQIYKLSDIKKHRHVKHPAASDSNRKLVLKMLDHCRHLTQVLKHISQYQTQAPNTAVAGTDKPMSKVMASVWAGSLSQPI